jgi:hypothetical protein
MVHGYLRLYLCMIHSCTTYCVVCVNGWRESDLLNSDSPTLRAGCASDLHRFAVRSFSRVNLKRCAVIIQVASDLHHEIALSGSRLAQPLQPAPGADMLVLAGDIHSETAGIELYSDHPIPVIYIHGNHEPYQCAYPTLVDEMREQASTRTALRLTAHSTVIHPMTRLTDCDRLTRAICGPSLYIQSANVVRKVFVCVAHRCCEQTQEKT